VKSLGINVLESPCAHDAGVIRRVSVADASLSLSLSLWRRRLLAASSHRRGKAAGVAGRKVRLGHLRAKGYSRAHRYVVAVALCVAAGLASLFLASIAVAEGCPNAAIRTGPSASLPDCRAYEQVTPVNKNGGVFEAQMLSGIGSDTGGAPTVVLRSLAAIAGIESSVGLYGAIYSTTRTASGWLTAPDPPSASEYNLFKEVGAFEALVGASLDGRSTLWLARRSGQPNNRADLFVRRPGGVTEDVGPVTPPGSPEESESAYLVGGNGVGVNVGAVSGDLSHILYQSMPAFANGFDFWPIDETNKTPATPSLYELIGANNTAPMLVGLDNGGKLVSKCGTWVGDKKDRHNAISADANTVFFTAVGGKECAGSDELYARIDNGQPDAHTVAISEPSKQDCEACDTEPGIRAKASFVGASVDGSKVFFTNTQPLLGGDASENVYEYDFEAPAGHKMIRVSGGNSTVSNPAAQVQGVVQSSEDGSHVYFIARGLLTTTPNGEGQTARAGANHLYVFERDARYPAGRTEFIADASVGRSNVTPDGRFLLFLSSTPSLTPDDTSTASQLFEYDSQTGELTRVSIGQNGYNDNGNTNQAQTEITSPVYGFGWPAEYWRALSVSADGSYVFFESNDGLTPKAINDPTGKIFNVYEYHDGNVYLISDGQDTAQIAGGSFLGTDASGADVFLATADRLVPQDTDTNLDIYDARVGGGFPAPVPRVECSGDGCQGPLSAAPLLLSPGSEFQQGEGVKPAAGSSTPATPAVHKQGTKRKPKRKTKKKKGRKAAHRSRVRTTGGRS
jgi:hypothetical protein